MGEMGALSVMSSCGGSRWLGRFWGKLEGNSCGDICVHKPFCNGQYQYQHSSWNNVLKYCKVWLKIQEMDKDKIQICFNCMPICNYFFTILFYFSRLNILGLVLFLIFFFTLRFYPPPSPPSDCFTSHTFSLPSP